MGMRDLSALLTILACPLCGVPFKQEQMMLRCQHGHSFDLAREGYVNFLRKPLPGDTKEMLLARRTIFEQGIYQPLADALSVLLRMHLPSKSVSTPLSLYDAGCGEGYYVSRLHESLLTSQIPVLSLGCDISKEAVRLAAKRYPVSFFHVANIKERLPLADNALDILLNIFAPRNTVEFTRVMAPGALLLIVIPGPRHLVQLRSTLQLLSIEEQKQQHVVAQFSSSFTLLTTEQVTYERLLQNDDIVRVVMMTPNYWHLTEQQRLQMRHLDALTTSFDFRCLLFRGRSIQAS
jgi:23S rRNA (guanine745-N1)-methyltransferase